MDLYVYNTAKKQKEKFEPLDAKHIKMYVCGPTVYNYVHIGNARPAVVFDTLFRVLNKLYPQVTYARNITDIDDKIMEAAKVQQKSLLEITQFYADEYQKDMAALFNLPPSISPYATHHVQDMINMVAKLVADGFAYEVEHHVLFSVKAMEDYGRLSHRSLEDMLEGARVEVAPYKRYAGDFVLWKPSTLDEPGWDSPWGRGRPGWHLECSAMVERHLGESIDIHGGGRDLIFPHHENEIAQSQCAHGGKTYARYWMHNGFINMEGEKMSKSLGNFKTVRDLLNQYPGEVIRLALLTAQYRSDLEFSAQLLDQSHTNLDSFYGALRSVQHIPLEACDMQKSAVFSALCDDLNTPLAISELHALAKQLNKATESEKAHLKSQLMCAGECMGLLQQTPEAWFKSDANQNEVDVALIEQLIEARQTAKLTKNYARSDEIRQELLAMGILLEDSKGETRWRRA